MTLQALAKMVRLSPSMLSLVECGRTSPSLTTLAAMAHGFGISLTDLIAGKQAPEEEVVIRIRDQPAFETPDKILRRVLRQDSIRKIDIAHNEYGPNIGNSADGLIHSGHEYGFMLEGELTVEVGGVAHILCPSDLLSLRSTRLHKIWNDGDRKATAIWFNVQKID